MASPSDNVSRAADNVSDDASKMADDIRQLRDDIAQLGEHLRELGGNSVNRAQQAAKDGVEQVCETAEDVQNELCEFVRAKPIAALAVAAGVGYLFALISRR